MASHESVALGQWTWRKLGHTPHAPGHHFKEHCAVGHPEGVRQVRAMGADQQRSSVHPLHLHTREKISFGTGSEEDAFGPSPLPTREHATAAVYWERPSPLASRSAACSQIAAWPLVTSTLRRALGNAPRMWRMILRRTDASHQKLPYRSGGRPTPSHATPKLGVAPLVPCPLAPHERRRTA